MLPACVKTDVWRECVESLCSRFKVPVVCGSAVFGRLSFFQELRNRLSDSPFSDASGIKYVVVDVDGVAVFVGPFRTSEPHCFDEELSDALVSLPVWKDFYSEFIEHSIKQAVVAGRSECLLKDSLSRAKLLLEFSQSVAHVQDVERALLSSVQFLSHKFKLGNVFVSAFGKSARLFAVSSSASVVEERIVAQLRSNKSAVVIPNVQADFSFKDVEGLDSVPKCVVGFPMVLNREFVGFFISYSEVVPFVDGISEVLYELVNVLSRLSQFELVKESASTDGLTGLSNRASLFKSFDAFLPELSASNSPVSVLMLDVDNFKKFNDTFGHPEGDVVLRSVAGVLKSVVPKGCFSCRYGGEEFMVVLPGLSQSDARDVAEKICAGVRDSCRLTISIGMIFCMNSSVSRDVLIKEADRALYRAKHLGKNRVVTFVIVDKGLGVIDA